jgi:hypothetical protein
MMDDHCFPRPARSSRRISGGRAASEVPSVFAEPRSFADDDAPMPDETAGIAVGPTDPSENPDRGAANA